MHLAGWGHPVLLGAMIVARLMGVPVAVETDTAIPVTQFWLKRVAKKLLYPILFRLPAVFLPGGTRQKRFLQHYGVLEKRIVVAQMTVDVEAIAKAVMAIPSEARRARRTTLGIAAEECVFLFVGRLELAKGITVLLEAFSLAFDKKDNVRLLIAGDGALRGKVKMAAASSQRVRWAGRLPGEALLDVYATADVLVLPSVFEPWGLVVNEAMAAALPVIVSECVGCVDDLVTTERTGIVIDADRPASLRKRWPTRRRRATSTSNGGRGAAANLQLDHRGRSKNRSRSLAPSVSGMKHHYWLLLFPFWPNGVRGTRGHVFQPGLHDGYAMGSSRGACVGTHRERSRIFLPAAGRRPAAAAYVCWCVLTYSWSEVPELTLLKSGALALVWYGSVRRRPILGGPTRLGARRSAICSQLCPGIVRRRVRAGSDRAVFGRPYAL